MATYRSGSIAISGALTGAELVVIENGGPQITTCTTAQVAELAQRTGNTLSITSLATVGAGAITAASVVAGVVSRAGAQSNTAFSDTLPTGALLAAALPAGAPVGTAWKWIYRNTTDATATLSNATGTTVSVITTVPGGTWAEFLITMTAANTFTVVGIESANPVTASGTFTANQTTAVTIADTRLTAASVVVIGLKTVGGTAGGTVVTGGSAPYMSTVTAGTGFTMKASNGDTSVYNYTIIG